MSTTPPASQIPIGAPGQPLADGHLQAHGQIVQVLEELQTATSKIPQVRSGYSGSGTNANGQVTITFTPPFPDTNYAITATPVIDASGSTWSGPILYDATIAATPENVTLRCFNGANVMVNAGAPLVWIATWHG